MLWFLHSTFHQQALSASATLSEVAVADRAGAMVRQVWQNLQPQRQVRRSQPDAATRSWLIQVAWPLIRQFTEGVASMYDRSATTQISRLQAALSTRFSLAWSCRAAKLMKVA